MASESASDGDDVGGVGYISRLEVENFKSYGGHQVIGPFKRFTAVIGPNGSGKSNLMDAVAFVLGEKTKALRGGQLRDLVHVPADGASAEAQAAAARAKACRVTLVFCGADGEETHFTRSVTAAGGSEYRLNGGAVSYEAYDERLQACGVLIKARNCLVFQGDIDAVATKTPAQLTALLEAVSGSGALKADYEAAEAAKTAAEAATAVAFAKRKGAAAQKKQKKEQKEEAERHTRLADELRELKVRRYLFQLSAVEAECAALEAELAEGRGALAALARRQAVAEKSIGEAKKEAARLGKDALLADKKAAKAEAAAAEQQPAVDKAAEEAARVAKRLKAAEKALVAAKTELRKSADKVAKTRDKIADIEAAAAEAAAAAAAEAARGAFAPLTPELEAEYAAVKSDAAMRTHAIMAEVASEERAVAALRDVATAKAQKLAEVDARLAALAAAAEEAEQRREALTASVAAAKAALTAAKAAAGAAADEARAARLRGDALDASLRDCDDKLAAERASRRDTERERRLADAVATLSVAYAGVRGRLVDLIDVPNKKHRLAVTVALGRWADAVVTDNDATARECIKHLKEQRMERLTFIPLANVRVPAVDERLRRLGGSAKLAVDCCVAKGAGLERALATALGDTLVCDTHEEAKRVAFGSAERHKVVSLDGTLCARWGGITGGASGGGLAEGGTRFDRAAYEAVKARRAELQAEKAKLPSARDGAAREADAAAAAAAAQRTLAALQGDAKATAERGAKAEAEAEALRQERAKLEPEAARAEEAAQARAAMVAAQRARIDEITDRVCADFCKKVGAASMRQFEQAELAARARAADAAAKFAAQKAGLEAGLAYETSRGLDAPVQRLEKQIADCGAAIAAAEAKAAAAKAAAAAAGEAAAAARADAAKARAAAEAAETGVAALQREVKSMTEEGTAAKRGAGGKEAALAAAKERKALALRECAVEALQLPRLGGGGGGADAMDVDGDDDAAAGGSAGDEAAGGALDFSSLPRALAAAAAGGAAAARERERLDAALRAEIDDKAALLEKLAPNLKAGGQYEAVKERERALTDELEAAKAAARDATAAFTAKRAERYAAFMAAFNHIAAAVDPIYKALTRAPEHPVGGSAYLSTENAEEPFLHGVKFHAMPPTKRFRDMEALSGGEKTVAALALLFAVHSFRPSPFFVLDEVDAALDKVNVGRVAAFVALAASGGAPGVRPFQSLVISLKDAFYDKADALVGVYRDAQAGGSRTLTLDLAAYA